MIWNLMLSNEWPFDFTCRVTGQFLPVEHHERWLFNRLLNVVIVCPTYWILQIPQVKRYIQLLVLQEEFEKIVNFSCVTALWNVLSVSVALQHKQLVRLQRVYPPRPELGLFFIWALTRLSLRLFGLRYAVTGSKKTYWSLCIKFQLLWKIDGTCLSFGW